MRWGKGPRRVLEELDSAEIAELQAFSQLEPFEDGWLQAGAVAAAVANATPGSKGGARPWDWFPWLRPRPAPRSVEEQRAILARAAGNRGSKP